MLDSAGDEAAEVGEEERVGGLDEIDAAAKCVVLVGDAIVEGFADDPGVVLSDFLGEERAAGEMADRQITDFLEDLVAGEEEGRVEVLVVLFDVLVVLEDPGDAGLRGGEVMGGFGLAEEQQGGTGDLAVQAELGFIEEGGVVPGVGIGDLRTPLADQHHHPPSRQMKALNCSSSSTVFRFNVKWKRGAPRLWYFTRVRGVYLQALRPVARGSIGANVTRDIIELR